MTLEEGEEAIRLALADLGTDYIDVMFLHNVPLKSIRRRDAAGRLYESGNLEKRAGALKAFSEAKDRVEVRAVGLSTHSTAVLRETLKVPEIDVVSTPLNKVAAYVVDGSMEEHIEAIRNLKDAGKGVYVMKLLDAGRLRDEADSAIRFALQFHEYVDSWNIGMYDIEDVSRNLRLLREVLGN